MSRRISQRCGILVNPADMEAVEEKQIKLTGDAYCYNKEGGLPQM